MVEQNPIDVTQQQLEDVQQQINNPPTGTTGEIQSWQQNIENQLRGLQGKIDSGITAVRRDVTGEVGRVMKEVMSQFQSQQEAQRAIDALPEEYRGQVQEAFNKVQQAGQVSQPEPQPQNLPAQQPPDEVSQLLQTWGVPNNHPDLNWQSLSAGDSNTFLQSVKTAAVNMEIANRNLQGQQQAPAQQPSVGNPPTTMPSTGVAPGSVDEIYDQYNAGLIDRDGANQRFNSIGAVNRI